MYNNICIARLAAIRYAVFSGGYLRVNEWVCYGPGPTQWNRKRLRLGITALYPGVRVDPLRLTLHGV
jgi:hypothetical protein